MNLQDRENWIGRNKTHICSKSVMNIILSAYINVAIDLNLGELLSN